MIPKPMKPTRVAGTPGTLSLGARSPRRASGGEGWDFAVLGLGEVLVRGAVAVHR